MMKPVYDGNGNKIEFDTEKVFADSTQYKTIELNDNQLLKVFNTDILPDSVRWKIDFVFQNELMLADVYFPQAVIYSEQGTPIGYKFRKPAGYSLLRSIFIKSQFKKLFPIWSRENLVTLCISSVSYTHLRAHET